MITNSIGEPYSLTPIGKKMISIYARDFNNIMPEGAYLVLGDDPLGTVDSSRFGLIGKADILAVYPWSEEAEALSPAAGIRQAKIKATAN
jgi:hypothetical protein